MSAISRRTMLCQSGCFLASAFAASTLTAFGANQPKRRLKIGACDWSLGKMCNPDSFALAREIGLDGVQVSLGTASDNMKLRQPEVQKQFKEAARTAGVEIASLAIGELNNIPYKSDPRTELWVQDSVVVMQSLAVTVELLAFFGNGDLRDDAEGTAEVVRRLKKVAPKAEKAGVILGIESWLSAEATVRIMESVGSPAVKMYYDVCNSTERGYDVPREIRWLGKNRICEFHMKENGKLLGEGAVKFEKVRDAIQEIGFEGWMQIEGAVPSAGKLVESYKKNLEYLHKLFD